MPNVVFDSPDNPAWYYGALSVSAALASCSLAVSLFFIHFKSPRSIGAYRGFLMNISLWAFAFDLYMTVIYAPKLLFPAMVMCPEGLLKSHSLVIAYGAFAGLLVFFSASAIAVLTAFVYRHSLLFGYATRFLSRRVLVPVALLHVLYMSPTIAFYLAAIPDRGAVERAIVERWPVVARHLQTSMACSAMSFSASRWTYVFMVSCTLQFTVIAPISVFLIARCFQLLKRQRLHMTSRTYVMHRQLLVTLVFQCLVPMFTIFLPNMCNSLVVMFEIESLQTVPQVLFLMATLHSPLNTIMMLSFITPYRVFLRRLFCGAKALHRIKSEQSSIWQTFLKVTRTHVQPTVSVASVQTPITNVSQQA